MITTHNIIKAKIAKAERIARMREAIEHLETAIHAYEHGDDDGKCDIDPALTGAAVFVAEFETPNGPISLAAAAAAVQAAAIGYEHERDA